MKGNISEIFDSVQGEGIYFGERQLFVRFFGCNLSCRYCDTKQSRFTEYEPGEIIKELKLYHEDYHSVSYTGGEPLMQRRFLKEVLSLSHQEGFLNYLETNGTLPEALADVIDDVDVVAMDIKLPSASGHDDLWHMHYKFLEIASAKEAFVKMVVSADTSDADFHKGLTLIKQVNSGVPLVLQPNTLDASLWLSARLEAFRNTAIAQGVITCVIPQLHKMIGMR